ncbi:MAG: enoyl-CoA hydratase/isomerase family protein, partial [Candidatus Lokiarchaeota archaeon]|nr:enoyl-CoA hydratase/isomerase family protein [Candidatus Lokiarchaeota archaeon]
RFIDSEEADRIGLVSRVIKGNDSDLLNAGVELAKELLAKSPLGLRMTKQAINLSMDAPSLETMLQLENRNQMLCSTSDDLMEGVKAFFEKRKPSYPLK